ncbi:MAG: GtrA family protein [Patescibacteria group bacterium]
MMNQYNPNIFTKIRPHLDQFALYLVSGSLATGINYISFLFFLRIGIYYVTASVVSEIIGFVSAFILHKYIVFKKHGRIAHHFGRYCLLGVWNTIAISGILYFVVEFAGVPEEIGKLIGIATVVSWNFFLYKFFVYI